MPDRSRHAASGYPEVRNAGGSLRRAWLDTCLAQSSCDGPLRTRPVPSLALGIIYFLVLSREQSARRSFEPACKDVEIHVCDGLCHEHVDNWAQRIGDVPGASIEFVEELASLIEQAVEPGWQLASAGASLPADMRHERMHIASGGRCTVASQAAMPVSSRVAHSCKLSLKRS